MAGAGLTDPELVAAVERDFVAAWWLLAEVTDAERLEDDAIRWFRTGLPDAYCNQVLVTRLGEADADATIDRLRHQVGRDGAPFTWWVMPSFAPADLADRLEAAGLVNDGAWPALALDIGELVEPPIVAGLEIRRVARSADLEAYLRIVGETLSPSDAFTSVLADASRRIGFADDAPEEHFIGLLAGEPVATASLVVAGGSAGIYNVATLEPARRRGIGAAMTAVAVRRGSERGCNLATLQSSAMGRPIYERLGFRFVCDFLPFTSWS
jgi:GNAT superfamily N-acetyltransferase